ncbi:MAG: DNA polymerase III subunit delta' C-terminal domain-containing protein [Clostridiales bacterium]|jgi:DNA polymerase-3 subunit delta'|nr:DNA polymerase III subunit delta' [Eubacteriales bacterium]MDH7566108.1 DNA polymerase III subunit delta' C-terminal domain-containing protein [Clostridiales bacterium]
MNFNDIIGQQEVVEGLKNSIKTNKTGHAYIFNGPRGIGKKTAARIFAGLMLCSKADPTGTCGECTPCRLFANNSNPDFREIEAGGASIGVDDIRSIQGDIMVKPLYSPRKVYLILDAEKMTVQAQNGLLKTLEEPPPYATLILTTSNADALLETVKSRAFKYNFKKNTPEEVLRALASRPGSRDKDMRFIASYADGVIGTALELVNSEEFFSLREKTLEIFLELRKAKLSDIFDMYRFFEANKDHMDTILDTLLLLYRDMLVFKETGKENILINSDKKDIILRNVGNFTVQNLIHHMGAIDTTRRMIKQNANFQLAIEVMLMKLQEESAEW